MQNDRIKAFQINVAQEVLSDLQERLKKTRWSYQIDGTGWDAAFALFPKDISQPPREWAKRFFNVRRWTEMPRGGHFAAMEEPELLAADIRMWFQTFREGNFHRPSR